VAGAGWGWPGSGGARERERARLGNTRGAGMPLSALAWSERQRGEVELKVLGLCLCPERGRGRGLGCTPGGDRWGCWVKGVCLPAWRVEERGERSWERSWQDLEHARLGSPLLPLTLKFLNNASVGTPAYQSGIPDMHTIPDPMISVS
jgi:hypothetical protein